jgi:hypothetical protein
MFHQPCNRSSWGTSLLALVKNVRLRFPHLRAGAPRSLAGTQMCFADCSLGAQLRGVGSQVDRVPPARSWRPWRARAGVHTLVPDARAPPEARGGAGWAHKLTARRRRVPGGPCAQVLAFTWRPRPCATCCGPTFPRPARRKFTSPCRRWGPCFRSLYIGDQNLVASPT